MSDNKKYYYLKLKDNFYDSEAIKLLEQQENGYVYSNLYLKLCLLSLKGEGRLLFRNEIPYDEKMISGITGIPLDNIRAGMVVLKSLGLLKRIDSGEIYMSDIQAMIGHGSSEAERIAEYRRKIKSVTKLQNCTPEKEIEIKKEIEIYKEAENDNSESFEMFWTLYEKKVNRKECEKLWLKVKPELHQLIFAYIESYKAYQPNNAFRKDPERFIKKECWNDEIPKSENVKPAKMTYEENLKRFEEMEAEL